jgi:hypothetical protein
MTTKTKAPLTTIDRAPEPVRALARRWTADPSELTDGELDELLGWTQTRLSIHAAVGRVTSFLQLARAAAFAQAGDQRAASAATAAAAYGGPIRRAKLAANVTQEFALGEQLADEAAWRLYELAGWPS